MMKENTYSPLVSIVVITYNSMPYIIDTLNSIKAQTYKNIELIVSDDCSPSDNTVEAVAEWMKNNKDRFVRTELITSPRNTGISSNCNRGCRIAEGEWIKAFAGDDILKPSYIEEMLNYCVETGHDIACSDIELFGEGAAEMIDFWKNATNKLKNLTEASTQNESLLQANFVPAASLIYKREIWDQVGGYDEDCQLLEDYPFNINVTSLGHHIGFFEKKLVLYRENAKSVRYTPAYLFSIRNFANKYIYKVYSDSSNCTTVTTIILAHNNEDTISQTIENALWQIGRIRHNIVVVDNESTDNTRKIIEKYVSQYPNDITFVKTDVNEYCNDITSQYISVLYGDEVYNDNQDLYEGIINLHVNIYSFPYKVMEKNHEGKIVKSIKAYRIYLNTRRNHNLLQNMRGQLRDLSANLLERDSKIEHQESHINELLEQKQKLEDRINHINKRKKHYQKMFVFCCALLAVCMSLLLKACFAN